MPKQESSKGTNLNISKEDQEKIIKDSGILKNIPKQHKHEPEPLLAQAITYTVMLTFIFSLLQISYLVQYNEHIELKFANEGLRKLLYKIFTSFPPLLLVVYFTHKYVNLKLMQMALFLSSVGIGYKCMQLMGDRFTSYHDMRIAPALGTLWAYCLMQLELWLSVVNVTLVFGVYYGVKYINL